MSDWIDEVLDKIDAQYAVWSNNRIAVGFVPEPAKRKAIIGQMIRFHRSPEEKVANWIEKVAHKIRVKINNNMLPVIEHCQYNWDKTEQIINEMIREAHEREESHDT